MPRVKVENTYIAAVLMNFRNKFTLLAKLLHNINSVVTQNRTSSK